MELQKASSEILSQLTSLIRQLSNEQYNFSLKEFSGGSAGKHVRHVIELYECFLAGTESGCVNYDSRSRNTETETNREFAAQLLSGIIQRVDNIKSDDVLNLQIDLSHGESGKTLQTSVYRELAYNIEHAIHHMAIIKIGIENNFPGVAVDENFGVAYSTLRYQEQQKVPA